MRSREDNNENGEALPVGIRFHCRNPLLFLKLKIFILLTGFGPRVSA